MEDVSISSVSSFNLEICPHTLFDLIKLDSVSISNHCSFLPPSSDALFSPLYNLAHLASGIDLHI